jgi:urease accessory protein
MEGSFGPARCMNPVVAQPLLLSLRLGVADANPAPPGTETLLRLPLTADERTRLRGQRRSACGRDLLLQLPRGEALEPGERLASPQGVPLVQVEAAPEPVLVVHCADRLDLMRAAYHLGNRHVALELRTDSLRLLDDPVLAHLLAHRGLQVERCLEPFLPEGGAYGVPHAHSHP